MRFNRWVTLDAPLIQAGYLSATLLNSQTNPDVWRKRIEKTQKFYSWAMNNHWGTNYRAYQEGPTIFRFVLRPHRRKADPGAATRFSTGYTQPLLVASASDIKPLLKIDSTDVVITGLKPSDDGKGVIVRLFEASGKAQKVSLKWNGRQPKSVHLSDTAERSHGIDGKISLRAYDLVTVRADF
jgi:alpha-mannosidase